MSKICVIGSGGLIGSVVSSYYLSNGYAVIGIDNNQREIFFGKDGSVAETIQKLSTHHRYTHCSQNIVNRDDISQIFSKYKFDALVHCAAQPSHDLAASRIFDDFNVNAIGTLNLLELTRQYCKDIPFVYMSTNKVYGDNPNTLNLVESEKRLDFPTPYFDGIDELFSIDRTMHSFFGVSKLTGDLLVQEYGKYFGMNTCALRAGCLTGRDHAGVELHGFVSYITKCAVNDIPYTIYGYGGKQVRDQMHASDVTSVIVRCVNDPKKGEVFNVGGGRKNSASVLETIDTLSAYGAPLKNYTFLEIPRKGDHACYYTNMTKFKCVYPSWNLCWSFDDIIQDAIEARKQGRQSP